MLTLRNQQRLPEHARSTQHKSRTQAQLRRLMYQAPGHTSQSQPGLVTHPDQPPLHSLHECDNTLRVNNVCWYTCNRPAKRFGTACTTRLSTLLFMELMQSCENMTRWRRLVHFLLQRAPLYVLTSDRPAKYMCLFVFRIGLFSILANFA